jgi:hypothetical protein
MALRKYPIELEKQEGDRLSYSLHEGTKCTARFNTGWAATITAGDRTARIDRTQNFIEYRGQRHEFYSDVLLEAVYLGWLWLSSRGVDIDAQMLADEQDIDFSEAYDLVIKADEAPNED